MRTILTAKVRKLRFRGAHQFLSSLSASIPASPRVLEKKAEGKGLEKRVSGENGKELAKLPRRAFYF